jgi:hypothetical protein
MSEGPATVLFVTENLGAASSDPYLGALAKAAAILEWPLPRERDEATCHELARIVDALLVRVARGRGALDVALGEALDMLGGGARSLKVGYSGMGDYAREELGIAPSTAQKMARFARALRERPILRAAVRAGEVTLRAAEAVLPKAKGEDEAVWVERARAGSVRGLKAAVKEGAAAATGETIGEAEEGPGGFAVLEDDEKWGRVHAVVTPEQQARIDAGLRFARKLVGAAAPKWQLLTAMCQDHLGGHELPGPALGPDDLLPTPREELDGLKGWLEKESAQWAFLDQPAPIAAPELCEGAARDARILHGELRRLALLRDRWDEVFGHLALLFRSVVGWRWLDFASFEHYCTERLGMAVRSVEQRAALERDLYELPALREAMCAKRGSSCDTRTRSPSTPGSRARKGCPASLCAESSRRSRKRRRARVATSRSGLPGRSSDSSPWHVARRARPPDGGFQLENASRGSRTSSSRHGSPSSTRNGTP